MTWDFWVAIFQFQQCWSIPVIRHAGNTHYEETRHNSYLTFKVICILSTNLEERLFYCNEMTVLLIYEMLHISYSCNLSEMAVGQPPPRRDVRQQSGNGGVHMFTVDWVPQIEPVTRRGDGGGRGRRLRGAALGTSRRLRRT